MKSSASKIVACCLTLLTSSAALSAQNTDYVPGEVLIRYKKVMSVSAASSRLQQDRLVFLKKLAKPQNQNNFEIIRARVSGNETVGEAIKRLSQNANVESVQPNFIYKKFATTPNDTYFAKQWALKNTGQNVIDINLTGPSLPSSEGTPAVSGKDMNLTVAWDAVKNCADVVVAVIDSGIHYSHEDLAGNMWMDPNGILINHGYDTINDDNNPMDDNGHGTHVAGTIGAIGNNAKGTTGVCWAVQLMAIKVLNAAGSGTTASIAEGIVLAVDNGADVINMSLGGGSTDAALLAAVRYARDEDVVVVTASGNDGKNNSTLPIYPCNHREENTVCVAATGQNNRLAGFSNFSTTYVDVGAPGINIISPWTLLRENTTVLFSAGGWTNTNTKSAWLAQPVNGKDAVTVPANWDGSATYEDESDARIHFDTDFTGYSEVWLQRGILTNLGSGDTLKTYVKAGVTDPFTGGFLLETITNSNNTGANSFFNILDVSPECTIGACTIGFHFASNTTGVNTGIVMYDMKFAGYKPATTGYNMTEGTSMAAPHVAGLAALLLARNPDYTAADVIKAIKNGGTTNTFLASKTTTGKSVSATGSLSYIQTPTGVTAVQN